jgi:hypothetical protein
MQKMMKYEFKKIQSMVKEAITKQMEVWCCFLFQVSLHAVLCYYCAAGRGGGACGRWLRGEVLGGERCQEVGGVRKGGGLRRWALLLLIFVSFSCLS